MSTTLTQPAAPEQPPYPIPPRMLHVLTLALPRPAAEEPATAWQQTVQAVLDHLDVLNPRNALEAFLAIQFIALGTAALDACRLAFEAGASAVQARQRRGADPLDDRPQPNAGSAAPAIARPRARLGRHRR